MAKQGIEIVLIEIKLDEHAEVSGMGVGGRV